ncbi:hypothetical protein RYX36_004275 [Vicia faba]
MIRSYFSHRESLKIHTHQHFIKIALYDTNESNPRGQNSQSSISSASHGEIARRRPYEAKIVIRIIRKK